ncbi:hypothetical protein TRICI_001087 [Trichomonascus ciferrii]|uniref:Uncharacterized protein n=1 Tax=Trichomonascus ciferrii TaxID=44093 RepID=A0A642VAR5_9ASCO|nr:hypothetical protein TRICI_001087 [Trichomonascus ciferrii]
MSTYSSFTPITDLTQSSTQLNHGVERSSTSPPAPINTSRNHGYNGSTPMMEVTEPTPDSPTAPQLPVDSNPPRVLQRSQTSSTIHAKSPPLSNQGSPKMSPVSEQNTSGGGNPGIRSRATSFVRGIVKTSSSSGNVSNSGAGTSGNLEPVGSDGSHPNASNTPGSPLNKLRRLTSRKSTGESNAPEGSGAYRRRRLMEIEGEEEDDDSESEEEAWPKLKSPTTSDDDEEEEEHAEEKNIPKRFLKRLL